MLFILTLVLAIALTLALYQAICDSVSKNSDLQSQLAILNEQAATRQSTIQRRAELIGLTKEYQIINGQRGVFTENLEVIFSAIGEYAIKISSISYDTKDGSMLLTCEAVGYSAYEEMRNAFESFRQALSVTGRFFSVSHPPLDYPASGCVEFQIETEEPPQEDTH
ncbi:hypothetical protein ACFLXE_04100 [Chloroflexota bacterium]